MDKPAPAVTPVIVECRIPQAAATLAAMMGVPGFGAFAVDTSYTPVAVQPATPAVELSLLASQEQLMLLRGTIDKQNIPQLLAQPNVVAVHNDSKLSPFDRRMGISRCDDWLIDVESSANDHAHLCDSEPTMARGCLIDVASSLGADRVWQEGINGEGVVIGIVDGGIWAERRMDPNLPGLVPRVIDGWPKANWGTISAWRGHGNMSAIDALGMAPRASIYDIRISDATHQTATMSDAIAGFEWAIEKFRATGTPQILSCGWGIYQQLHDPSYATDASHPLTRKVVEAMDEGMLVLFAAGNGGDFCPATWCGDDTGPGKSIWGANGHPRVMTVGAVNKDEELISYSSQGPAALDELKPDFCGISHFAGYFCSDSGTSAACAVAAGVVALLKQARPTLTQLAAKRILRGSALNSNVQGGTNGWDQQLGAGIIRAKAAYDLLVSNQPLRDPEAQCLEQLKAENQYLRDLCIEMALDKKLRLDGI